MVRICAAGVVSRSRTRSYCRRTDSLGPLRLTTNTTREGEFQSLWLTERPRWAMSLAVADALSPTGWAGANPPGRRSMFSGTDWTSDSQKLRSSPGSSIMRPCDRWRSQLCSARSETGKVNARRRGTSPCGDVRAASKSASGSACRSWCWNSSRRRTGSSDAQSSGSERPQISRSSTRATIFAALPVACPTRSSTVQPSRFDGCCQRSGGISCTASMNSAIASPARIPTCGLMSSRSYRSRVRHPRDPDAETERRATRHIPRPPASTTPSAGWTHWGRPLVDR